MEQKTIIFTGGGSGGHVMPALTLIESLVKNNQYKIEYIGSHEGIEKSLVTARGISYTSITTGKLRRYLSFENLKDLFKVVKGIFESLFILVSYNRQNTLVFSTGGFVSVPVVIAAKLTGKPVYIHEQTSQVGLANKIASFFAEKVFISFDVSKNFFPKHKTFLSGYPLREECFNSNVKSESFENIKFSELEKPLLFVTGGGNGSKLINDLIKSNLESLKRKYFIIHQVGKNYIDEYSKLKSNDYIPLAFINSGMIDLYKSAEAIISRAGAGTVCELIALNKPSILIPLKIAQKNEQFHNAKEAEKKINSVVIEEKDLEGLNLTEELGKLSLPNDSKTKDVSSNGTEFLLKEIQSVFIKK